MAGKSEGRAHPAKVDRCSLVRREIDYHEGIGLEVAPDIDGEYNLLVPSRCDGDSYTW